MDYLLNRTMQMQDPASVAEELQDFETALRLQVFSAGSDDSAGFLIRRYQCDLEALFENETHRDVKLHLEKILSHIYTVYPHYCNVDHMPPAFFQPDAGTPQPLAQILGIGTVHPAEKENTDKLELSLTVAQVGVLLHLFYELDIFRGYSRLDIIRFIAVHFSTRKQPSISYESLYGKFFKMEPHALDTVKDLLIKMINIINHRQKK